MSGALTASHAYNPRGRLTDSTVNGITTFYDYDEAGQRIRKHSGGGGHTLYVSDLYETNELGEGKRYIHAGGLKVATLDHLGVARFHHPDHLSGASVTTDEDGEAVGIYDYYPYGAERIAEESGGLDDDYKYTGQEQDEETGLYYYGARYYDPVVGRFAQVDPVVLGQGSIPLDSILADPQTLNAYAYARNNSLKFNDPSGEWIHVAIGAAVGAVVGVGFQVASDIISKKVSSFSDYAGAATGGAVSGAVVAANPTVLGGVAAGALGTASSSVTSGAIEGNVQSKEVVKQTLIGAATGAIPAPKGAVGSIPSVAKQITTKLNNGAISNISMTTAGKLAVFDAAQSATGETAQLGLSLAADQFTNYTDSSSSFTPAGVNSYYTVKAGDTLSGVFGSNWRAVAEHNNLSNPNLIKPGQKLEIPGQEQ